MKWTNHDRLHAYGVYLVGWPKEIPPQNPSSLKADQNKRLLELLDSGKMKFMKIATSSTDEAPPSSPPPTSTPADEESESFLSWIHYDEKQPSASLVQDFLLRGLTCFVCRGSLTTPNRPLFHRLHHIDPRLARRIHPDHRSDLGYMNSRQAVKMQKGPS